jgi:hypothetical protein
MAIYTFEHEDTQEQVTINCPIAEYDEAKKGMAEQGYYRVYVPLMLVDGAGGDIYAKSDNGWKQMLNRIKSSSGRGNTIPSTGVNEV